MGFYLEGILLRGITDTGMEEECRSTNSLAHVGFLLYSYLALGDIREWHLTEKCSYFGILAGLEFQSLSLPQYSPVHMDSGSCVGI